MDQEQETTASERIISTKIYLQEEEAETENVDIERNFPRYYNQKILRNTFSPATEEMNIARQ